MLGYLSVEALLDLLVEALLDLPVEELVDLLLESLIDLLVEDWSQAHRDLLIRVSSELTRTNMLPLVFLVRKIFGICVLFILRCIDVFFFFN